MPSTFGEIKKDFTEEGPFRAQFFDINLDDPKILSSVKLWMTDPDTYETYFLANGNQTTLSSGEVIYEFFGNTQNAQRLKDDDTLTSTVVELETDKIYLAEVSYELDVVDVKAVGARREVLVRESYSIKSA